MATAIQRKSSLISKRTFIIMVRGTAGARSGGGQPGTLGSGLRVRGHVRGEGDLAIEAEIEGDVSVSGQLRLQQPGRVTGGVAAQSMEIAGTVEGDLKADGAVVILATGQVRGDIAAGQLTLEEGAQLDGRIDAEFDLPEAIA